MIYIVRHGQTDWNVEKRCQGSIDIELNEQGIKQAEIVKEKLKNVKFDYVFSSPLKRAYKTAEIICNNSIITDNRLMERGNGDLEGKLMNEIKVKIDYNNPNETRYNIEPLLKFRKRIDEFLDYITTNFKNKNILIVTHAGVSIYAKCYFDGDPDDGDYLKYRLGNCEVFEYNNTI